MRRRTSVRRRNRSKHRLQNERHICSPFPQLCQRQHASIVSPCPRCTAYSNRRYLRIPLVPRPLLDSTGFPCACVQACRPIKSNATELNSCLKKDID